MSALLRRCQEQRLERGKGSSYVGAGGGGGGISFPSRGKVQRLPGGHLPGVAMEQRTQGIGADGPGRRCGQRGTEGLLGRREDFGFT